MTRLTPGQAEALVQLRALLDQAQRSARTTTAVGRLTALVLLDAVNERVVYLAIQTLPGVEVRPRDSFEEMHNKIKDALGGGWDVARSGWSDVRTLHRSRNSAQHEGIGADPALLPGWSIATATYTASVVSAAFHIELANVHLSSAIQTPELQTHLQRAEELLRDGDAGEGLREINAAFTPAFQKWLEVHERVDGSRWRLPRKLKDAGLDRIVKVARDLTAAQAFATEPGEYVWFSELRQASGDMVTEDEVHRALVFVFWWIVRWESVNSTLMSNFDRRIRLSKQIHLDKSREAAWQPARINKFEANLIPNDGRLRIIFDIDSIPGEEVEYFDWSIAVRERMKSLRVPGVSDWYFSPPSEISAVAQPAVNTDELTAALLEVLRTAEADVAAAADRRSADNERERADREAFSSEIEIHHNELPDWVQAAYLSKDREFNNGVMQSRLRLKVDDDIVRVFNDFSRLLKSQDITSIIQYSPTREIRITPELAPADLIVALRTIEPELSAKSDEARRVHHERVAALAAAEAAHKDLETRLAASLNRAASPVRSPEKRDLE